MNISKNTFLNYINLKLFTQFFLNLFVKLINYLNI